MINPSLDLLENKVDCRYTLVILAAKRAREIVEIERRLIESSAAKPITAAMEEISQGKVTYQRVIDSAK